MQWPENWEQVAPQGQQILEAELKREVTHGHLLYSVPVQAIARQHDRDDVLFAVVGSPSVAVVHLAYDTGTSPLWPHTQFYGSLEEWAEQAKA